MPCSLEFPGEPLFCGAAKTLVCKSLYWDVKAMTLNSSQKQQCIPEVFNGSIFYPRLTALQILIVMIFVMTFYQMDKLTVKTGRPSLAASFSFWESTIFLDPALRIHTCSFKKHFGNKIHFHTICQSQQQFNI